jgi:hypothetical protein
LPSLTDFENCGSQGRTYSIANHGLVFMIHGPHMKWKQPVAYYFTHGNTKAEVIFLYLMELFGMCWNAGLKVIVAICNIRDNNVKALKLLGVTKRKPFFIFHNQEIAIVHDPPHLQSAD